MKTTVVLTLSILVMCSCLRYVPSRDEMTALESEEGAVYEGEEAFYGIEARNRERLQKLLDERRAEHGFASGSGYRIGAGDVLELSVFDVDELNRKVRVRPSGEISLPLVGTITASGLTEEDLLQEIKTRLEQYVYDPQVQVFIAEYESNKISVIGEVHRPGAYPLRRNDYLLTELLSEAGGRTEKASGIVLLVPAEDKDPPVTGGFPSGKARAKLGPEIGRHGIEIYFDDLVGSLDATPLRLPLRPGDTIIIPEAGTVQVDGEVNQPGSYQLASRMSLSGAIAAASGLTYSADVEKVEVIREIGSGRKAIITLDLEQMALKEGKDIRLRDGDMVRVPSHGGRFVTRQVTTAINSIFNVGVSRSSGQ